MGAVLAAATKAATSQAAKTTAKAAATKAAASTLRGGGSRAAAKAAGARAATKSHLKAAAPVAAKSGQHLIVQQATKEGDNIIAGAVETLTSALAHSLMTAAAIGITGVGLSMVVVDKVQDSGMGFAPWMMGAMGLNMPGFGLPLPGLPDFGFGGNAQSGGIVSPLPGVTIEQLINYQPSHGQSFGPETGNQRSYGAHGGIDFDCRVGGCAGATVAAMMSGKVTATEVIGTSANGNSYRVVVQVQDWLGTTEHRYVHVDSLAVGVGDNVTAGQVIAKVAPTDSVSTGPHLDLKIWNGTWINPQTYMKDALSKTNASTNGGQTDASPQGIYQGLKSRGMSPLLAAAFVGNIGQESGFDPAVVNPIGAAGLVQWLDGRRQRLNTFAATKGTHWTDVDTQLDFILHELNGSESAAYSRIKAAEATGSLEATVRAIAVHYERMGAHEIALGNRINYARQVYR